MESLHNADRGGAARTGGSGEFVILRRYVDKERYKWFWRTFCEVVDCANKHTHTVIRNDGKVFELCMKHLLYYENGSRELKLVCTPE